MSHLQCWEVCSLEIPGAAPTAPALSCSHADLKAAARLLE